LKSGDPKHNFLKYVGSPLFLTPAAADPQLSNKSSVSPQPAVLKIFKARVRKLVEELPVRGAKNACLYILTGVLNVSIRSTSSLAVSSNNAGDEDL
jgi:hypothetical protein